VLAFLTCHLVIFILLGVGIDDAFIINDAFERVDQSLDPAARLVEAFDEVGPAVLLTSLTDFVAFLGISYKIAAILWFCTTAAIAVFAVFLFQITFFSALVVLNKHRQQARLYDICPLFPWHARRAQSREGSSISRAEPEISQEAPHNDAMSSPIQGT